MVLQIANAWRKPYLDEVMIVISDPYKWITPMLALALFLIFYDWQSGIQAIIIGALSAGSSDWINAKYIKPNVDRIRPGKIYAEIQSLGSMNRGKQSFPSNHASNTMAFTLVITLFFPILIWILLPFTLLVGYSRIYCGAHYPLDVLGGWLHGSIWASFYYFILNSWMV